MIQILTGNIFETGAEAIVIPVNTVGVMGKGLALQATRNWPDLQATYRRALKVGLLGIGKVFTVHYTGVSLILFPTKDDWRDPSRLEYIQAGLQSLTVELAELKPRGVAIPALGCGLGGLDWNAVRPMIEAALPNMEDVRLYAPQ
jgi:O-acetyl-ADP-ribose deacetylase (regulator of RNase III)